MSSNGKDESSLLVTIFAFIGAALLTMALVVAAVAAFAALVLTVLSIFAWNRPLRIGRLIIEPEEARSFIKRGSREPCCCRPSSSS
jgi:hypothetical protein